MEATHAILERLLLLDLKPNKRISLSEVGVPLIVAHGHCDQKTPADGRPAGQLEMPASDEDTDCKLTVRLKLSLC
jgi:hypothetical protein